MGDSGQSIQQLEASVKRAQERLAAQGGRAADKRTLNIAQVKLRKAQQQK